MNKLKFFLEKTKSSVKYLGVVALIISLSVMFSSISVMSLLSLAGTIEKSMTIDGRKEVGGDMSLTPRTPEALEIVKTRLATLKKEGIVKEYTFTSVVMQNSMYGIGTSQYINVVGYEDEGFPLANVKKVLTPNIEMKEVLKEKNNVIISEILAKLQNLKVGDSLTLNSRDMYDIRTVKLVGIVDSPINNAMNVYVHKDFMEGEKSFTFYVDGNVNEVEKKITEGIEDKGAIGIIKAEVLHNNSQRENKKFFTLLKGLSVLGLFVGSFGIASAVNTIIVRRKKEIGIMKSIGFNKRDISTMLLLEVSLISIIGSVLGVVLGYLFFRYLIGLLAVGEMSVFSFSTGIDLKAVGLSLLVSIVSSIVFAYVSISRVSDLKATYAIKDMDIVAEGNSQKALNFFRFIVVGLIFCGISVFLTQDIVYGVGAVLLVSVGILIFSLLFRLIFFLILRIRIKSHNFVEFGWNSLRQSYKKIIFAMVAIFIGMFAINFLSTLIHTANVEYKQRHREVEMDTNVVVTSLVEGNTDDNAILKMEEVEKGFVMYKAQTGIRDTYMPEVIGVEFNDIKELMDIVEGDTSGVTVLKMKSYVEDEKSTSIVEIEIGDSAGSEKNDSGFGQLANIGDVAYVVVDGKEIKIPITGLYTFATSNYSVLKSLPYGGFMTKDSFNKIGFHKYVKEYWLTVNRDKYPEVYDTLSKMPNTIVESSFMLEEQMNMVLDTMVKFSVSIASLALLAGIILIIIVTVLDVTSRGRDFAIYKTLGFRQREVTGMVLLEYGLMTVITSVFASLSGYGVTLFINKFGKKIFDINQKMLFDLKSTVIWNIGLILLVLILVYMVSRKPLKVKPTEVLRYE